MSPKHKTTAYLIAVFALLIVSGACHTYYKASPAKTGSTTEVGGSVDSLQKENRYFILRSGSEAWYMKNIELRADQKSLTCVLDSVSYLHKLHFVLGRKRKMQYQKNKLEDLGVLNEVHLFIPTDNAAAMGSYTLSLEKVNKIEVIEKDKKRTANSYVIGGIGYTLGAFVVVAIILAATKSSCPFVSAYDGNEFSLQGEIYGGSIYPQLARNDYIPLKMSPKSGGTLQVKISNELHERQYTDMANLWVITHDKKTKVLSDEQGSLYSIADAQAPFSAELNNNRNVLTTLKKAGDYELLYMDDSSKTDARNEVVLKFNKPAAVSKGKLVLTLKNSYWLDLLYGEVAKGFGTYYATYMKEQKNKSAAELLKWVKEQQIPLEISVKTKEGWKKITDITTIGPLATREIVVPVELPASDESIAAIKLSSGFMFWEIDYAALDFTDDNSFTIQKLTPSSAKDETGNNVLAKLQKEDGLYLEQPKIGNTATLTYKAKINSDPSKTQTYILEARGYYEHIRDFKNKPDVNFLSQFKKPNGFPVYGMQLYKKVKNESLQSLADVH
ncbi:MAG: hypothetical protein ABI675_09935 [Chitinophagaceae bacterium]